MKIKVKNYYQANLKKSISSNKESDKNNEIDEEEREIESKDIIIEKETNINKQDMKNLSHNNKKLKKEIIKEKIEKGKI